MQSPILPKRAIDHGWALGEAQDQSNRFARIEQQKSWNFLRTKLEAREKI